MCIIHLYINFERDIKESIKKVQNVGIIFDMDGTLWDSTENITKAWNEVLVKYGYGQLKLTVEQVSKEMGKLMRDIADSLFKDIPENIRYEIFEECLSYENEYLFKNGANVYDGVEDVFKELNKKYNVFIVSNCQEGYLRTFLEYYDFNKYVLDYEEAGRTGMPKDENIRLVIKRNHLDKAFYVGDTLGDMESADKAGIPFIHAAYGFGTVPADRMKINNIKELPEFIDDLLSKDTDN